MTVSIRPVSDADVDHLLALWRRGGVGLGDADVDRVEIDNKLGIDPDLFLVAVDDGALVASIMGTYDGHRGRIKRAVVDPAHQGTGLGRQIVEALEQRFLERGITELRLEVEGDNTGGQAFWATMGWQLLPDIKYYTRSLR